MLISIVILINIVTLNWETLMVALVQTLFVEKLVQHS
jgi:hypothetical protein